MPEEEHPSKTKVSLTIILIMCTFKLYLRLFGYTIFTYITVMGELKYDIFRKLLFLSELCCFFVYNIKKNYGSYFDGARTLNLKILILPCSASQMTLFITKLAIF